jgi:hypothetical protein
MPSKTNKREPAATIVVPFFLYVPATADETLSTVSAH